MDNVHIGIEAKNSDSPDYATSTDPLEVYADAFAVYVENETPAFFREYNNIRTGEDSYYNAVMAEVKKLGPDSW
jgi:hypothetical protein